VELEFSKFHGAGNDFVVACDNKNRWNRSPAFINNLCRRHTGIGADGLILLSKSNSTAFDCEMNFFNNDGHVAEMCGNGLRCAAQFASKYILKGKRNFKIRTLAGILRTEILSDDNIKIEIPIIKEPEKRFPDNCELYFANTGVPHLVCITDNLSQTNIEKLGSYWRNHSEFAPSGVNVNFIQFDKIKNNPLIQIRTYERGLECESNACGTGIAASALCLYKFLGIFPPFVFLTTSNDKILIDFSANGNKVFDDKLVFLTGNAIEVYRGVLIENSLSDSK